MLPTDGEGHFGADSAPTFCANEQQFTHPFRVQAGERVFHKHTLLNIGRHKAPRIIARQTIGHLG